METSTLLVSWNRHPEVERCKVVDIAALTAASAVPNVLVGVHPGAGVSVGVAGDRTGHLDAVSTSLPLVDPHLSAELVVRLDHIDVVEQTIECIVGGVALLVVTNVRDEFSGPSRCLYMGYPLA